MTLDFHTLDVFTDRPFAGNPLAVVLGADALSAAQMQTIAREFNLSETIFVMAPRDPRHRARVRIFLPGAEIPFAGHPTIGCAIHLAGLAGPGEDADTAFVIETEAGPVPVTVTRRQGRATATFTAPVAALPVPTGATADLAAAALGLPVTAVGPHRVAAWRGGPAFLYVPLRDRAALAAARPDGATFAALVAEAGATGAYLYAPGADCDWQVRMFAPGAGVAEDPATGSAAAILPAQLLAEGRLGPGTTRLTLHQGDEMGRPSRIVVEADVAGGAIAAVRVTGAAVPVASGTIAIPSL